jgi:hypothetical protein
MPTDTEILVAEIKRKDEERAEQLRVLENDPKHWKPRETMSNGYAAEAEKREERKRAAAAEKAGEES